jgi:hypothetical protein
MPLLMHKDAFIMRALTPLWMFFEIGTASVRGALQINNTAGGSERGWRAPVRAKLRHILCLSADLFPACGRSQKKCR